MTASIPRAGRTRRCPNPRNTALPADRANARTHRNPWPPSCSHHPQENRQRILSPMCLAATVTEDIPRLAASLALSTASEAPARAVAPTLPAHEFTRPMFSPMITDAFFAAMRKAVSASHRVAAPACPVASQVRPTSRNQIYRSRTMHSVIPISQNTDLKRLRSRDDLLILRGDWNIQPIRQLQVSGII